MPGLDLNDCVVVVVCCCCLCNAVLLSLANQYDKRARSEFSNFWTGSTVSNLELAPLSKQQFKKQQLTKHKHIEVSKINFGPRTTNSDFYERSEYNITYTLAQGRGLCAQLPKPEVQQNQTKIPHRYPYKAYVHMCYTCAHHIHTYTQDIYIYTWKVYMYIYTGHQTPTVMGISLKRAPLGPT